MKRQRLFWRTYKPICLISLAFVEGLAATVSLAKDTLGGSCLRDQLRDQLKGKFKSHSRAACRNGSGSAGFLDGDFRFGSVADVTTPRSQSAFVRLAHFSCVSAIEK